MIAGFTIWRQKVQPVLITFDVHVRGLLLQQQLSRRARHTLVVGVSLTSSPC